MTTVLVLGMHRSGTSALGRLLDAMGLATCRPEHFMRSHPSNPHGHFEVRELADVNDELLNHLGGSWRGLPPGASKAQLDLIDTDLGRRAHRIAEQLLIAGHRFWKDPRLCLLAPFWGSVLGDTAVLLLHRNPAEVAASLATRDAMPTNHALALWQASMTAANDLAADRPSLVLGYEQLQADPVHAADRLSTFLGDLGINVGDSRVDAIDPAARHHFDPTVELDPAQQRLDEHLRARIGSAATATSADVSLTPSNTSLLAAIAATSAAIETDARTATELQLTHARDQTERSQWLRDQVESDREREGTETRTRRHLAPIRDSRASAAARSVRALGPKLGRDPTARRHLKRQLRNVAAPAPRPVAPVTLATSTMPVVSLIVPASGRVDLTSRLLRSIADCPTRVRYEVIVVDDASDDDGATQAHIAAGWGVKVVTNAARLGYRRSAEVGVAASLGEFVVLLHNDIEVEPGWLDALVDELADPTVGAVGPRQLRADRSIDNAGSVVWADGGLHPYGRGSESDDSRVMHPRDIDYSGAACLAVRRELWDLVGGYDQRYHSIAYAAADLCFGIREFGYRIRYQPDAVVLRSANIERPADNASQAKFVAKWAHRLSTHEQRTPGNVAAAANRAAGLSILVIGATVPSLHRDPDSNRMYRLITQLVDDGHRVRLLTHDTGADRHDRRHLQRRGVELAAGDVDPVGYVRDLSGDVDVVMASEAGGVEQLLEAVQTELPDAVVVDDDNGDTSIDTALYAAIQTRSRAGDSGRSN